MNRFSLVYFPVDVIQSARMTEYLHVSYSFVSSDAGQGYPPITSADVDDFVDRLIRKDFPDKFKKRFSRDYSKLQPKKFWALFAEYFKDKCGDYRYTEGLTGRNVDSYRPVKDTFGVSGDFTSTDKRYVKAVRYYIVDLDDNVIFDRFSKIVNGIDGLAVADGRIITTGVVVEDISQFSEFVDVEFWKGAGSRLYLKPQLFFDKDVYPLKSSVTELYLRLAYEKFAPGSISGSKIYISGSTDVSFYLARCLEDYGYECYDRNGKSVNITELYSDLQSGTATVDVKPATFPGKTLESGRMPNLFLSGAKAVLVAVVVLAFIYALLFTKTAAAVFDAIYDLLPDSVRAFLSPLAGLNVHRWRETEVRIVDGGVVEAKTLLGDGPTHLVFSDVGYVDASNFSLADKNGLMFIRSGGKVRYYVVNCSIQNSILVFKCRRFDGVTVEVSCKPRGVDG